MLRRLAATLIMACCLGCGEYEVANVPQDPATPVAPDVQAGAAATGGTAAGDAASGGAALTPVAGTRVSMIKPEGFNPSSQFRGFDRQDIGASIVVVEIPGPYSQVTSKFTADGLRAGGIILRKQENVTIGGKTGMLLDVTQVAGQLQVEKWILVFGTEQESTLITATMLQDHAGELSAALRTALLSTTVSTGPVDLLAGMDFTITTSDQLKLTQAPGKMLAFTKDGVMPSKSVEDPLFIAVKTPVTTPIADLEQAALQRLQQTATTKINSIESKQPIEIAGLKGFEIEALGQHTGSGAPLAVYLVLMADSESLVMMQGLVGASQRQTFLPQFKAMARSYQRKAG